MNTALATEHQNRVARWHFLFVFIAALFAYCWNLNALPLTDYDEATYAQVTTETLTSGDILTLKRFGASWFEKPPLYFWLSMAAVRALGEEDYVFRLTSALLAAVSVALVWLIAYELSSDPRIATAAAVVLLASPFYYIAARQARLDIPMIAALLGSLAALVYGWRTKALLVLVLPSVAVGFLFKSFVALLALPLMLFFCIGFRRFQWLRSIWFWCGGLLAMLLVLPWHWHQAALWGSRFVQEYVGYHVLSRYGQGIGQNAGFQAVIYLQQLLIHAQPWISIFTLGTVVCLGSVLLSRRLRCRNALFWSAAVSALFIFFVFAFARTRILTYMLPLFPFMALAVGWLVGSALKLRYGIYRALIGLFIAGSLLYSVSVAAGAWGWTLETMHPYWDAAHKVAGLAVRNSNEPESTFYLLNWPIHESLRYYSGKQVHVLEYPPAEQTVLKGPWYLFITDLYLRDFFDDDGSVKQEYEHLRVLYEHDATFFLLAGDQDLTL